MQLRQFIYTLTFLLITPSLSADELKPLVDVTWLKANLDKVVVVDVRKKTDNFSKGHIPSARLLSWKQVRGKQDVEGKTLIKMQLSAQKFETLMRSLGINNDDTVIVTYEGKNISQASFATRVYWMLRYFKHDKVAVLDGGNAQWIQENNKLDNSLAFITASEYKVVGEDKSIFADLKATQAAIKDDNVQLLDTRTLDFYLGVNRKSYVAKAGHIPSSKIYPNIALVNWKKPATFIDPKKAEQAMIAMGLDTNKPVIVYCNSGHYAASGWFMLSALLGKENVSLYDGSMHEWAQHDLPLSSQLD